MKQPIATTPVTPSITRVNILMQTSKDEDISANTFCKLEVTVPNEGSTEVVVVTLDKIEVVLEKKIDGSENKIAGIKISPFPKQLITFSSNAKVSLAAISHVISKIFALLSTDQTAATGKTETYLRSVMLKMFSHEKMEFVVFRDMSIKSTLLSDIDQRMEIITAFTPTQERPNTVAKGNLNFDRDLFTETHIALYYNISLEEDLKKLEDGLKLLFRNVKSTTSEESKNESKTLMSFKEFSNRFIQESVENSLTKSLESSIREGLSSIAYNPSLGTLFTPPIKIEFPIKWDSLKNVTMTDNQKLEFGSLFNNPEYTLLVDGKKVTVTPSTFTFDF